MKRAAVGIAAITIAVSTWACASLLDIHAVPLARDAAAEDVLVDAPPDAPGCRETGTFCEQQCPQPDFCDDFEGTRLGEKWTGFLGFQNPVLSGEDPTSVAFGLDDAGARATKALFAQARSARDNSATAVLATAFDLGTRNPRGLRLHFSLRPATLTWENDGGTARRVVSFLAIGSQLDNQGVGVMWVEDQDPALGKIDLILQQRALGNVGSVPKTDLVKLVSGVLRSEVLRNGGTFDITIGTAELLRELGLVCSLADAGEDAGGPETLRFHASFGTFVQKCTHLQDALVNRSWLSKTSVAAGVSVSDFGSASAYIDDVAIWFID